jgi:hypothetical protein
MRAVFMVLLLAVGAAHAAEGWRVDGRLVRIGDSQAEVLNVAGKPDMRNRIESREGGTVGNRWYYVIDGYNSKTVIITFRGGRVVDITMER